MSRLRGICPSLAIALAVTLFAAGGCESNAPTLPIPPPGFLTPPDAEGYATLSGSGATPEALFLAYNEDAEVGVIAKISAAGDYSVRIPAATGDTVVYWIRVGVDDSPLQSSTVPGP